MDILINRTQMICLVRSEPGFEPGPFALNSSALPSKPINDNKPKKLWSPMFHDLNGNIVLIVLRMPHAKFTHSLSIGMTTA